jgi:hypothetical protein
MASPTPYTIAPGPEPLAHYCPDLALWPKRWSGNTTDLPIGEELVNCFRPFLLHLLTLGLSRKTLRQHRDNLWCLGGEMIRDFHDKQLHPDSDVSAWLREMIGEDGGPLLYHNDSQELQRSFNATCRRLSKFIQHSPSNNA